jgi:4-diphosphocytidyl-2-C-methyl-D-erythritol kinase
MTLYDLPAPAKLNLFLHVVGKRADGYHSLETLFRLISLSDSISLDLSSHSGITRDTNLNESLPEQDDLVVRAARALQAATSSCLGAHISVNKRIPVGGGLGGGSSDAATVLIGLNRLWRCGLNRTQLMQIGLTLGADVPFFIFGQSAFAQGVGELLTPVALPTRSYLVIEPTQSVATQKVFGAPDLTRNTEHVKITDFPECGSFVLSEPFGFGKNDLQPVVFREYPVVFAAYNWLCQAGLETRLTGSGGCLFSEHPTPSEALKARHVLLTLMSGSSSKAQVQRGTGSPISNMFACDGFAEHPLQHWVND